MGGMARETSNQEARRPGKAVVLVLCALVFALHAATVRPGHPWWGMDDFTAYLAHGRNLLEGRPYDAIDTVSDPALPPSHQRTSFPPAFSLLVGIVDRATTGGSGGHGARAQATDADPFADPGRTSDGDRPRVLGTDPQRPYGLDILSLKRMVALFTALSVLAVWAAFRRTSGGAVLLLAVAAYGFSPYVFAFRELVRSEMVFLTLLYVWLAQVQGLDAAEREGRRPWGRAALCGLVLAAAYATRTAAIVLPPTLLATDLLRARRIRRTTWVVLGVAGACILAQRAAFSAVEGGYLDKAAREWEFSTITFNLEQLAWNYERLWSNGVSGLARRAVAVLAALVAAVGFLSRLRRPTVVEVFTVLYTGMILVLPTDSAWMRYQLPVLPFILLCLFTGARVLGNLAPMPSARLVGATAAVVLVTYAGAYAHLDYGPLEDGLTAPTTVEAFDWVDRHTAPDDVVVFKKARALTFATGRPSLCYPELYAFGELPDEELWRHFGAVDAKVFLLKHTPVAPSNLFRMLNHSDDGFLERFVSRFPDRLVEVWRNADFVAFEVRD